MDRRNFLKNAIAAIVPTFSGFAFAEPPIVEQRKNMSAKQAEKLIVKTLNDTYAIMIEQLQFEINDSLTRQMLADCFRDVMLDFKKLLPVSNYYVECSEVNNTAEIINANKIVVTVMWRMKSGKEYAWTGS